MRQQIIIDDRRLSYLEVGKGEVLLLIHAFPLSAEMWESQLRVVPQGWRVIAPDIRGFGKSDSVRLADSNQTSSIDDYAGDIVTLLKQLKINRVVICGLSMGGYIAYGLLRLVPERVRGLIISGSRLGEDSEKTRELRQEMQVLVDQEGAAAVARQMVPRLLSEATRDQNGAVVSRVAEMIGSASPLAIKSALQCLMTRPDSTSVLESFGGPTLLLAGEEDLLIPPREVQRMRRLIERATFIVVPCAGHLVNLERPEEFNIALAKFLAENFSS